MVKKENILFLITGILSIALSLLLGACVEPYDFRIENQKPNLVVEGFISNVSYNETLEYPSDGRHFAVKLRYTSDVINIRDEVISDAQVQLIDNDGSSWSYVVTQEEEKGPIYLLLDPTFYAENEREYKLKICLPEGDTFESAWVSLPNIESPEMGDVGFVEDVVDKYVYYAGEQVIQPVSGIVATLDLPENRNSEPLYYRWTYDPIWIYKAPLPLTSPSAVLECWAKNPYYLSEYELQEDFTGGYQKELFFMSTYGNNRIYEKLSVLITQQILNQDYYYFWKDIKEKASGNAFFDKQPYNLPTNFSAVNNDNKVSGYFDVVYEQAKRWYFDKEELSYQVENNLAENCIKFAGPDGPDPQCSNCLEYSSGVATAEKPSWWDVE